MIPNNTIEGYGTGGPRDDTGFVPMVQTPPAPADDGSGLLQPSLIPLGRAATDPYNLEQSTPFYGHPPPPQQQQPQAIPQYVQHPPPAKAPRATQQPQQPQPPPPPPQSQQQTQFNATAAEFYPAGPQHSSHASSVTQNSENILIPPSKVTTHSRTQSQSHTHTHSHSHISTRSHSHSHSQQDTGRNSPGFVIPPAKVPAASPPRANDAVIVAPPSKAPSAAGTTTTFAPPPAKAPRHVGAPPLGTLVGNTSNSSHISNVSVDSNIMKFVDSLDIGVADSDDDDPGGAKRTIGELHSNPVDYTLDELINIDKEPPAIGNSGITRHTSLPVKPTHGKHSQSHHQNSTERLFDFDIDPGILESLIESDMPPLSPLHHQIPSNNSIPKTPKFDFVPTDELRANDLNSLDFAGLGEPSGLSYSKTTPLTVQFEIDV